MVSESEKETISPLLFVDQFTGKSPMASCEKFSEAITFVPATKSFAVFADFDFLSFFELFSEEESLFDFFSGFKTLSNVLSVVF